MARDELSGAGVVEVRIDAAITVTYPPGPDARTSTCPGLSTVSWFATTFGVDAADDPLPPTAGAGAVLPGAGGVLFVPTAGGGTFFGLTYQSGFAGCVRAVQEGLVHAAAARLRDLAPTADAVHVTGPGAGSDSWRDLLAAATGLPVSWDDAAGTHTQVPDPVAARRHGELALLYQACRQALLAADPDRKGAPA